MEQLLRNLCAAPAPPGLESAAAKAAAQVLSRYCEVTIDRMGNVIGTKPPSSEGGNAEGVGGAHILLDAHLDQIAMAVTGYEDGGFLRVADAGGMDPRVLAAQEVTVHGKRDIFGVIPAVAPHLSKGETKAPDWPALCVDTGLDRAALEEQVPLGTRVTLRADGATLRGGRFASPALDNRAGVAAVLRCLELLENEDTCRVTVLFSAQEETGGSGAKTAGFTCGADCAIVVDVSFAQAPDIPPAKAQGKLGGGAMVGISPLLDHAMSEALFRLAKARNIPCQAEVMGGRTHTNADNLQACAGGIPCALLSIPLRNMHTAAEVADMNDIEATAQLMAAYIKTL